MYPYIYITYILFIYIYIYAMFKGIALRITKQDFIRDAAQKNPENDAEEWDTWTFSFFQKISSNEHPFGTLFVIFFLVLLYDYMVMSRK